MKGFKFCLNIVFPHCSVKSVTFIYAMFLVLIFFITQIVYASTKVNWLCTLYNFGGKWTYAITRRGHIHRLFLPIILHAGFAHIFWNIFCLFLIGFSMEKVIGKWYKYVALIVFGGLGGNILSATLTPYSISVGASSSLMALQGATVIWFYLYWSVLAA